MNAPNRTLTPSQLAQLEQAYAKGPGEAWCALAEAYLARGRYMESMMVAKRGARASPDDPAPHLMLARIYGAQRKVDKARAAVAEALKIAPDDVEVVAAAREHGLAAPAVSAAPAVAATAAEGVDRPAQAISAEADAAASEAEPPGADDADRSRWSAELVRRYGEPEPEEPSVRRRRAKRGLLRTAVLAVALGVALAGAAGLASSRRARSAEQQQMLGEAKRLLTLDSWAAYRDAQATCERAAGLGGDAGAAHGCAAWAAVVRWAEHGEGEPLRAQAVEHLSRSGPEGERPRDAVLAAAWLKLHAGDARGAADMLRALSIDDGSAPVRAALGVALAEAGDPDGGRDALLGAQQLAPGSPRIAQQLADQLRRRGGEGEEHAATLYEIVLQKLAPDHAPSLIGKAHLLLDVKNGPAALTTARRVAELKEPGSPRQRARALALEARALALMGKKAEAETAQRDARNLDSAAPELREPLAQAQR
jgi:tetratricopeptide (TPR) repeat protein